jgi:MFS family permease
MVPKERTGSAMGLLGTVSAVGTALGPSMGGLLITWSGWPAVFAVMAAGGAVALLLALQTLPADHQARAKPASLDMSGVVLLAPSLAGYALSMTLEVAPQVRATFFGLSMLGLAVFVAMELRSTSPLIQLRLLRDVELATGLASLGLVSAVVMATLVVGPFYLSGTLRLSPLETGLVMSVGPWPRR